MSNLYLPAEWTVARIREEIEDHFFLELSPPEGEAFPDYIPGQFYELSIPGIGEAPISISSSPTRPGTLEMCIRKVGRLTAAVARLARDSKVGLRGPLGNGYQLDEARGRDVLILAGGLGIVPLRSLVRYITDRPADFSKMKVLYGARSDKDLLFYDELVTLGRETDAEVELIAQEASEDGKYRRDFPGQSGFVTDLVAGCCRAPADTFVAMCGPPVFYRYAVRDLLAEGFSKSHIYMSLERRMECGVGKCGHCSVGYRYTCIDGPIFNYWDAFNTPELVEMREGQQWINS
jgi:NAD(P)H-flavin reductase